MDNDPLIEALGRNSELLAMRLKYDKDWRMPLRNGILAGFGGVIGATLVVSLVLWILQPFRTFEPLKGTLDRLSTALEQSGSRKR